MQNHAKVGGILSIVAGAFGVLGVLFFILMALLITPISEMDSRYYYDDAFGPYEFVVIMVIIYILIGGISALLGVLAIVGGIFALRKRYWGWALVGSISAALVFFPCGVPAIIFIAMGKPEFGASGPPVPAAPITG